MTRPLGASIVLLAVMFSVVAAQDQDPPANKKEVIEPLLRKAKTPRDDDSKDADPKDPKVDKKDVDPKDDGQPEDNKPAGERPDAQKKDPLKRVENDDEAGPDAEDPKQILSRLRENFDTAEDKLIKKDAPKDTLKVQDDIIADLDKLIKQQQDQQNGGGGGGGGQASAGQAGGGGKAGAGQSGGQGKAGGGQAKAGGNSGKAGGGQPKNGKGGAAGGQKDGPKQLAGGNDGKDDKGKNKGAGGQGGNDGKDANNGGLGGMNNAKKTSTIGDLFPDIWGHLPRTKRQEMEAYSKERFMPLYENLLRQYYRTIAEQGRRD